MMRHTEANTAQETSMTATKIVETHTVFAPPGGQALRAACGLEVTPSTSTPRPGEKMTCKKCRTQTLRLRFQWRQGFHFAAATGVQAQEERTEPDARLIAAAPELLEALEKIARQTRNADPNSQAAIDHATATAAIAKATGRADR